jgi:hypothetical protein
MARSKRWGACTAGILLVLMPQSGSPETDPWTPATGGLTRVFHHICENPTLMHILTRHAVEDSAWHAESHTGDRTICLVADYVYKTGTIYCELFPAPGSDELWILDGRSGPDSGDFPTLILHVRANDSMLAITGPSGQTEYHPVPLAPEARLSLSLGDGVLDIRDLRAGSAPPGGAPEALPMEIPAPGGVYLAIPCYSDSCPGCGFAALNIDLPDGDVTSWREASGYEQ